MTKKLTVADTRVHFQLWDAAGQERFRALMPLYYRGAQAAILVYDVTDETSLQDIKFWIEGESSSLWLVLPLRPNRTDSSLARHSRPQSCARTCRTSS